MVSAKLFTNGASQAVRLPKEYRFEGDEVLLNRIGNIVMLIPESEAHKWDNFLSAIDMFSDDFLAEPIDPLPMDNREPFL